MPADLLTLRSLHPEWDIVDVVEAPNGGLWAMGRDGGVFTLNAEGGTTGVTAPFAGSGFDPGQNRTFEDMRFDAATGQYTLVSNIPGQTWTSSPIPAPAPAAGPAAGAVTPPPGDDTSGRDIFTKTLIGMGFTKEQAGSLGSTLWTSSKTKSQDALYADLIGSTEYAQRFPGMKAMREAGTAISESQYVQLERSYKTAAISAGLPPGFYDDPSDFGKLIANGVSPAEYSGRIQMAQTAALGTDPTFREALAAQLPDANLGDLTAFFLDPDKGTEVLNQKFVRAQMDTSARRSGFGVLTKAEIDDLQARGGDARSAEAGFGQLAALEGLTTNTVGESMTGDTFTRGEKLGVVANDPKAQIELEQRRGRRQAGFSGGGGAASGGGGKQGIG